MQWDRDEKEHLPRNNIKWAPWGNCKVVSTLSESPIPGVLLWNFCITFVSFIKLSIPEAARPTEISRLFGMIYKKKTIDYNMLIVKINSLIFFSQLSIQTCALSRKIECFLSVLLSLCETQGASEDQTSIYIVGIVTLYYLIFLCLLLVSSQGQSL